MDKEFYSKLGKAGIAKQKELLGEEAFIESRSAAGNKIKEIIGKEGYSELGKLSWKKNPRSKEYMQELGRKGGKSKL